MNTDWKESQHDPDEVFAQHMSAEKEFVQFLRLSIQDFRLKLVHDAVLCISCINPKTYPVWLSDYGKREHSKKIGPVPELRDRSRWFFLVRAAFRL